MNNFFDSQVAQAVGWSLVHFIWQGAFLALIAKIILSLCPPCKSDLRYSIACSAICLMLMCPIGTTLFLWHSILPVESSEVIDLAKRNTTTERVEFTPALPKLTNNTKKRSSSPQRFKNSIDPQPNSSKAATITSDRIRLSEITGTFANRIVPLFPVLLGIWAFGVIFLSIRLVCGWCNVQRLHQCGKLIDDPKIRDSLDRLKTQMNIHMLIPIRESIAIHSPMVIGWLKPVILLPVSAMTNLTSEQLSSILAHELAHVRRADYLVHLFQSAIEILLFYHPAVWWISNQIRKERENCCDDLAIKVCENKFQYVQALLKLEKVRSTSQLAMASDGGSLVERVARITGHHKRPQQAGWGAATVATLVVISLFLLATPDSGVANEFGSQDVEAEQDTDLDQEKTLDKMKVTIIGPDKKPIMGAQVMAGIWYQNTAGTETYVTDENGDALINLPQDLKIIRIWANADSYTTLFANWEENEIKNGTLPPGEFTIQMIPAVEIGGTIVDEQGIPIPNVSVEVRRETNHDIDKSRIQLGTWLAEGTDALQTDENGRWSLDNVPPGENIKLAIKLTHSNFISDERWGELQLEQSIGLKELRDQTAQIVMRKGVQIRGQVTDPEGEPVDDALIVWGDNPYFQTGSQETSVENDGTYETPVQKNGKLRVTVIAPGYAPQSTLVDVGPDLEDTDFSLSPGNKLEIEFVDIDGNPVSGVYVGIQSWQDSSALYNNRHPNVAPTKIPIQADAGGLYLWDWAPEDEVTYSFHADGYTPQRGQALFAGVEPHTIVLKRPAGITGHVIDESGNPIPSFRVIPRLHLNEQFTGERRDDSVLGMDGRFSIKIRSQPGNYSLKIEADGYETNFTQPFDRDDLGKRFELTLKKAASASIRVVNAAGKEVPDATVVIAPVDQTLSMNGYFDKFSIQHGEHTKTNETGVFQLSSSKVPRTVIIISEDGYSEFAAHHGHNIKQINLKKWASIQGGVQANNKPWNTRYFYSPIRYLAGRSYHLQMRIAGNTDGKGTFRIPKVAAMAGNIGFFNPGDSSNRYNIAVDLQSGKALELDFSKMSHVSASIQLSGANANKVDLTKTRFTLRNMQPSVNIPTELVQEIKQAGLNELNFTEVSQHFQDTSNWNASTSYKACFDSYSGVLDQYGKISIDVLRPGSYELSVLATAKSDSRVAGALMANFKQTIEIGASPVDLGELEVEVFEGPEIDTVISDFEFTNLDDETRSSLSTYSGNYILLDFWTPWCDSCKRDNSKLHRLAKLLAKNGNTKLISLMANGSGPLKRLPNSLPDGLTWVNGQLDEAMERQMRKNLGVWTSQHFVLIDPKGKLVFGGSFAAMSKTLEGLGLK